MHEAFTYCTLVRIALHEKRAQVYVRSLYVLNIFYTFVRIALHDRRSHGYAMSRVALSSKGLNSIPDLTIAPLETFPDETASVDENGEKFVQED